MKTEKVFAGIFILAILFKLMHWPGGDVILVLSLSTIAFLYFPFSIYFFSDKSSKNQNLMLSIIAGFFLSIIPIGLMFKLQYWPGGEFQLLIGTLAALILLVIIFVLKGHKVHLHMYYKNMWIRTIVLGALAGMLYLVPLSTQLNIQHWDDAQLAKLKYRSYTNPDNQEYRQAIQDYMTKKYK